MDNRVKRYFDIMAQIIRNILEVGEFSNKDFQSVLTDMNNERYLKLIRYVPQIITPDRKPNDIKINDLTDRFMGELNKLIQRSDFFLLLLLLYFMDRSIEACYERNVLFETDIEHMDALNTNAESTQLIILKKVKCCWSHTQINKNLKGLLSEFYYIDLALIPKIKIQNHVLDATILDSVDRSSFKFAISPLTKGNILQLSEPYVRKNEKTGADQHLFRVEKVLKEELITEKILSIIDEAGKNKVDLLVFPEMMGTENMLHSVRDKLRSYSDIPALIVFPSIWKKTDDDKKNTNRSCMLLFGDEIIFEQDKLCDYNYEKDGIHVYEDINRCQEQPKELHLLHIKELGRICIIICYDYLETENREAIVKNLCPTLICTPSFSTGNFDFQILAQSNLSRDCNWIWCNTCAAANYAREGADFSTVGIITQLSKKCNLSDAGAFQVNFKGKTLCERKQCDNCIYFAEIPIISQKSEVTR